MSVTVLLFLSMLKIGCFAFGGGYAIIALLENEFITKRKWIDHDEFLDVVYLPIEEVQKMMQAGEIKDAKTLIALQAYLLSQK